MNRSLKLIFPLIAACCLIGLTCSDYRPAMYRYEVEKRLHQAEKLLNDARLKSELANPAVVGSIKTAFASAFGYASAVVDSIDRNRNAREWEDISRLMFRSGTRLSQLMFSENKFDSSLAILRILSERVSLPILESASLKVNMAQVLQSSGRWPEAVAVYSAAVELLNPPVDPNGQVVASVFELPAHIYRIERRTSDAAMADNALKRAFSYYRSFVGGRNPNLALAAHGSLAGLYADARDWRACVRELDQMRDSTGSVGLDAQVRIADIYAGELGNYDTALSMYTGIASRLIGQDTALRPILLFKRSLLFMEKKQYVEARRLLSELDRSYHNYFTASPGAQQVKARSFELEGNWGRAETEYRFLIENYAGTEEAMQAYLYLGEQFAKQGRTTEAERWMQKADAYYQQSADRSAGTTVQARALSYKAEILRRREDWSGAAEALTNIFTKFPDTEIGQKAVMIAVGLYREKLANPAVADSLVTVLRSHLVKPESSGR